MSTRTDDDKLFPWSDPEKVPDTLKAQPKAPVEGGDRLGERMPECDTDNPAELEAWYSAWGFADHWRKVVLANCREIERARAAARNEKLSEARIDDRARTSDPYVDFLITHLQGRRLREAAILGRMGA
jgi:hypothetical protein